MKKMDKNISNQCVLVCFHPLVSFYNTTVHLELFFYRYRKIRDLRAAKGKSEIVTSYLSILIARQST